MERMGEEKIGKLLLSFSIPAMIGMMVNAMYTVIDRIFVGRGVGALALTGVTLTFPYMMVILGLSMLIGIGATTLVSIRLGEQKKDEAEKIVFNAFAASVMIAAIVTLLGYVFLTPMLKSFGAEGEVLKYATDFMTIMLAANILQILAFVMTAKTEATIVIIPKSLCGSILTTAIDEISPQIFAINSEKNTY